METRPTRSTRVLIAVCSVLLAILTPAAAFRNVRVQFTQGASSATMHGHIEGRELINYRQNARAGQMMHVYLETRHPVKYFNVFEPGKSPGQYAAFYSGTASGNTVEFRTS